MKKQTKDKGDDCKVDFFKKLLRNKKSLNNVLTALFIGILLIIMSSTLFKSDNKGSPKEETEIGEITENQEIYSSQSYEKELEEKLEKTLSMVDGVGKIKVMVTTGEGYENALKNDSKTERYEENGSSKAIDEEKTVLSNDGEPIILKEIKPKIEGIIVVAEGGDNVLVKSSLINAIKALLGIEIHKIEILKMK